MKILAIRGKNLASLTDFSIDFTQAPLAQNGLFVITGPTGAGKSTLLDALCLALFDRMPRLPGGSGVELGNSNTQTKAERSNDVRGILRRGCGSGYAEVDFIGQDRGRYRARWDVRRARHRAAGNLQAQTVSLRDLAKQQPLGGTKTETLALIQEKLGLSFDQFRHAVILPQGEFAAFLKARKDERSELLELLTGTGIYSRLSIAAHQRAKQEKLVLEQLQARLDGVPLLSPEERAALSEQSAQYQTAWRERETQSAALQQALNWQQRLSQLQQTLAAAEQQAQHAAQAWQAAAQRREQLAHVERAQLLRPLRDALQRAVSAQSAAAQAVQASNAEHARCQQLRQHSAAQAQTAQQQREAAERAWQEAQPTLQAARACELELSRQRERTQAAQTQSRHSETRKQAATAEVQAAEQRQQQAQSAQQQAEAWLAQHPAWQKAAQDWPHWHAELKRYQRLEAERQTLRDEQARRAAQREQATAQQQQATAAVEQHNSVIAQQQQHIEDLRQEKAADDLSALQDNRRQLEQQRERYRTWLDWAERGQALTRQQQNNAQMLHELEAQCLRWQQRLPSLSEQLNRAEAAQASAQAALERAKLAQSKNVQKLRAQLEAEQPCPVCGSLTHPWQQDSDPLGDFLQAQRAEVKRLEAERDSLLREDSEIRTQLSQGEKQKENLHQQQAKLGAELQQLAAHWQAADTDLIWLAEDNGAQLQARLRALAAQEAELAARERRWQACDQRLNAAQQELEQQQSALKQLQQRLQQAQSEAQKSALALQQGDKDLQRLDQELADLQNTLSEPLQDVAGWQTRLSEAAFVAECDAQVRAWQTHSQQAETAARERAEAEQQIVERRAALSRYANEYQQARRQEQSEIAQQQQLETRLRDFFGGDSAEQIAQGLQTTERDARQAWEQAQSALHEAEQALSRASERQQAQQRAQSEKKQAAAEAQTTWAAALAERGLEPVQAETLLAYDAAWRQQEQADMAALDEARQSARIRREELARQLSEHQAACPDERPTEALSAALAEVRAAAEQAQQHWADKQARLRQDDAQRNSNSRLQKDIDAQRQRWEDWQALNELIGSSDGQKFRNYAQSLTLDAVLAYANRHLLDIKRRYQLAQAPGLHLELQIIDREMGDEIRSVHSLSGGESFLVSLALALGLASLSSDRIQVESLFIDEGFGSLDADSLDIALNSLEALESVGRKVGVISHVHTLVERIGTQIRIRSQGGGESRVEVRAR